MAILVPKRVSGNLVTLFRLHIQGYLISQLQEIVRLLTANELLIAFLLGSPRLHYENSI
jgi:hypothetical protein